ncbi:MAG: hypothetical protein QM774_04495 [Gordonia sp. (in: high G+C Gram-positive bacteria)]|uniref:hypothetical protein n=1 Tax=Gordonia sp. (in: high G+C Gram-positive bacteria) TaxID=84139 RepID=UPI0039E23652
MSELTRRGTGTGEPRPGRAHSTFSGVHALPEFGLYPWCRPGDGGYGVRVDHPDPAGIVVEAVGVHDGFDLSTSYHPTVLAPAVISDAMSRFVAAPARYLN